MAEIPDELKGKYVLLSGRTIEEKGGLYTAVCDELGIATCAANPVAALDRLRSTATAVLNKATERGEILKLFKSRSIRPYVFAYKQRQAVFITQGERTKTSAWLPTADYFSIGTTTHSGYIPIQELSLASR